jgi:hypothetical protein
VRSIFKEWCADLLARAEKGELGEAPSDGGEMGREEGKALNGCKVLDAILEELLYILAGIDDPGYRGEFVFFCRPSHFELQSCDHE